MLDILEVSQPFFGVLLQKMARSPLTIGVMMVRVLFCLVVEGQHVWNSPSLAMGARAAYVELRRKNKVASTFRLVLENEGRGLPMDCWPSSLGRGMIHHKDQAERPSRLRWASPLWGSDRWGAAGYAVRNL